MGKGYQSEWRENDLNIYEHNSQSLVWPSSDRLGIFNRNGLIGRPAVTGLWLVTSFASISPLNEMSNSSDVPLAYKSKNFNPILARFCQWTYLMVNNHQIIDNIHCESATMAQSQYVWFLWCKSRSIQQVNYNFHQTIARRLQYQYGECSIDFS